jgi:hypothetical protein
MSRDLQWEWPWAIVELLAHQRAIDLELDRLLERWDAGEISEELAQRIVDLSDASEALAWGRGEFHLE